MDRTIFALFDDALAALNVASTLERNGYDRDGISLLVPDPRGRYAEPSNGVLPVRVKQRGPGPRVFRSFALPGLGPAAITGPLASTLGQTEQARRGLAEALVDIGFAEPTARHYFESFHRGQALLSVTTREDGAAKAVELMRRLGARAVDDTVGKVAGKPESVLPPALPREAVLSPQESVLEPQPAALDQVTVPVMEEQLEVGKRQVERGGVRIHSHIVEQPIQESVSLREERLTVERRPVYRDATDEDLADFKEGTIEIHETVEEPVITKRRRVVEEIVVGKETRHRTETISETLRKTEVTVESLEDVAAQNRS